MLPLFLAILFFVVAIVLFIADLIVPSHALFTALGAVSLLVAIGCVFTMNPGTGLLLLILAIIVSPLAGILLLKLWPATPAGRKLILPDTSNQLATSPSPTAPTLKPGDSGTTLTSLRPLGMAQFNETRVEVFSDRGILPPNTPIVIVSLDQQRPVVRATTPSPPGPTSDSTNG